MKRRSYLLIGLTLLLVVLVAAYIDGGEEPVRPIEQAISVPSWQASDRTTAGESLGEHAVAAGVAR